MDDLKYHEILGKPHVESFNHAIKVGFKKILKSMAFYEMTLPKPLDDHNFKFRITNIEIEKPMTEDKKLVYPQDCRLTNSTYHGKIYLDIDWSLNSIQQESIRIYAGKLPIMIKSNYCNLLGLSDKELIEKGEHVDDIAGYFIIRGKPRIARMLVLPRANFPIALSRPKWKNRKLNTTEFGIYVRSVRSDFHSVINILRHKTLGDAMMSFTYQRKKYYLPIMTIIRALVKTNDREMHERLTHSFGDKEYARIVFGIMYQSLIAGVRSYDECRKYLINWINKTINEKFTDDESALNFLLDELILPHCTNRNDKLNFIKIMMHKLYLLYSEKCMLETSDTIDLQEVFIGGYLYVIFMRQSIQQFYKCLKLHISKILDKSLKLTDVKTTNLLLSNTNYHLDIENFKIALERAAYIGSSFHYLMSTGNLRTDLNIQVPQTTGLVIPIENINRLRVMSYFKALHRGKFFEQLHVSGVRKLTGEAWGFICPAQTPDGLACGLLNHLTMDTIITSVASHKKVKNVKEFLLEKGMLPSDSVNCGTFIHVLHDGIPIGYFDKTTRKMEKIVRELRKSKIMNNEIMSTLEIVFIPQKELIGQYPGLYLFSGPFRIMRPVINNKLDEIEYIGTFEQVYLGICIKEENVNEKFSHREKRHMTLFSDVGSLLPLPEYNAGVRTIYACHMSKQAMGTPCYNFSQQNTCKLYRLITPHTPFFKTQQYDQMDMDNYPIGVNAVICVLSYTGYDMEDAIIINKAACERGFGYGTVYKSESIELSKGDYFIRDPETTDYDNFLDEDGLPRPGTILNYDDPFYCYYNKRGGYYKCHRYTSKEVAVIDNVRITNEPYNIVKNPQSIACITYRIPKPIEVGDKFANRSGQKNVCAALVNQEDLPFSENGLVPDIIFNPHGFTTRMTVSMFLEAMAGKSAALIGCKFNGTAFKFDPKKPANEYFSKILYDLGYNYQGNETFYSGITGLPLETQVFTGIVHYQRLRHMVSDKWQVRSEGPIDLLTKQPVAGRKNDGAVRFGEMERDALISHGCTQAIRDRMFINSDKRDMEICLRCESVISTTTYREKYSHIFKKKVICLLCENSDMIKTVELPYSYYMLCCELATMNIRAKLSVGKNFKVKDVKIYEY